MTDRRDRPVLLYDGECGVCRRLVADAVDRLGPDADVVPFQDTDLGRLGLSRAEAEHALQWVGPDGRIAASGEAVARLLIASGGAWSLLGRVLLVPPFALVAGAVYWLVARNRSHLPARLGRPTGR